MSAANPWAIWLAAAALPLFAAFLIRRWRRQKTVSSVVIFQRLAAQTATRQRLARPHHLLALLLSMLALAALVSAALEPKGEAVEARRFLVVLDTSASMSARELGHDSTRYARALVELADFTDTLNLGDEVALITAGAEASLELGWTTDHATLLETAGSHTPVGAGAAFADAFQIADAMCQQPERTEVILVSDGAGVVVPDMDCRLRYVRQGEDADNVALTGLTVREADALGLNEIYLAVHNASSRDREVTVTLELDGDLIDVATETIAANTTVERLLSLPLLDGELLTAQAEVEGENALAEDDVAFAVLKPGARVQALLLTQHPTTFLAEALRLHPRVDLRVVRPENLVAAAGNYDLLVVDSPYTGALPHADHMVILDAGAQQLGLSTSGTVSEPEIIRWSFDHPLFRFVNLDGVHLSSATATALPAGAISLMDMPDGPLVFSLEDGGQELIYFTFHPDRSDLPLRVAFVNLVANLVEWAQPADLGDLRATVGTGQRLSDSAPGLRLTRLTESGARSSLRLDSREPIPLPGLYAVDTADGTERGLVAANLFSAAEAALAPSNRLGAGAAHGWPEIDPIDSFPWWILALVALGLLALEWILPGLLALEYRLRRGRLERKHAAPTAQPTPHRSVAGAAQSG